MAVNNENQIKTYQYYVSVYEVYKTPDVPDTYIIRVFFPKHYIFISYRRWMMIKGMGLPISGRFEITPIIQKKYKHKENEK